MTTSTASFPPVDDAVSFLKNIDWADVRQRAKKGLNNCGLVIAVTGEKIHDLGVWLCQATDSAIDPFPPHNEDELN